MALIERSVISRNLMRAAMTVPLITTLACLCATVGIAATTTGNNPNPGAPPRSFIVGISPYLDNSQKDNVYRCVVRMLVEDLPLNSSLEIYDAFELKTIARATLPDARAFVSPKTRANQFASAIRDLKLFLAQDHAKPTNSHLTFQSGIRLPQFLDFLADNSSATNSQIAPMILLAGSPLYEDAREPGFSMVDGYFPSDGHLRASREKSIFGFDGHSEPTAAWRVVWLYFGDPWINELHKEKVLRFWTLYLERRGASLEAFTSDLSTAVQKFHQDGPLSKASSRQWALDPEQTKIEMLRVGRSVEIADWLTRDRLPDTPSGPPRTMVGPMKIGIRWKANVDVDLYALARPGAETLFFQHVRAPEGYYYKDHRSSPGKEYEFIEFDSPVDVREVQAFINFYKGNCPGGPRGEIRIEFDGRIYGAPFSIVAEEGNLGRTGISQEDCWTRIPIQEMLHLGQHQAAAR